MSAPARTIVARATPPGIGGIGVIRISGPESARIGQGLTRHLLQPREAKATAFRDPEGRTLDYGIAIFFKGPASYTGEDVLELHCHGGPVIIDGLLAQVSTMGADLARPGEFTERAFLNGKLDLAQAEAVADLINSQTSVAARCALRSLRGDFSREIGDISQVLGDLRVIIEANIDFSEEPVDDLTPAALNDQLDRIQDSISKLVDRARPGELLSAGAQIVLFGAPNAGKSSLLNALSGSDHAIVSASPGTTRDLIEVTIDIGGAAVRIVDTAGLRPSDNEIEAEGVRRAQQAIGAADLLLEVIDDTDPAVCDVPRREEGGSDAVCVRVLNKIDVSKRAGGRLEPEHGKPQVAISATQGLGLEQLIAVIREYLGCPGDLEDVVLARRRHLDALEQTLEHITSAQTVNMPELVAEELRLAQGALGKITGEVTTDDLLGEIFSSFCIGK